MSHAEAWFSVIQYVPDLDRGEGVNVGVALFCPGDGRVRVALADSNHTVHARFPGRDLDDEFISYAKGSLKRRLERLSVTSLAAFREVIDREANELVLTAARSTRFESEQVTLTALRRALVDPRPEDRDAAERATLLREQPEPARRGPWLLSLRREAA